MVFNGINIETSNALCPEAMSSPCPFPWELQSSPTEKVQKILLPPSPLIFRMLPRCREVLEASPVFAVLAPLTQGCWLDLVWPGRHPASQKTSSSISCRFPAIKYPKTRGTKWAFLEMSTGEMLRCAVRLVG